jgi:hypothetical protein
VRPWVSSIRDHVRIQKSSPPIKTFLSTNTAIHLSRHRMLICLKHHSVRPGDGRRWPELMHLLLTAGAQRSLSRLQEQSRYSLSILFSHYFEPKKSLRISSRFPCFLGFHSGSVWLS